MEFDWQPVILTIKLASATTMILMLIGLPIAWWIARTNHWSKQIVASVITLPLILPPTVLGFYLLIFMGPNGPLGQLTHSLGLGTLAFSFSGLVLASVIYSLPFAIQPMQTAFSQIDKNLLDAAATLGASARDRFFSIVLPIARPGMISAAVLAFAHTVGEFGVILMIGGNIPGETKVLSIAIYDHVETLQYDQAHMLAGGMLAFSFVVLLCLFLFNQRSQSKLVKA